MNKIAIQKPNIPENLQTADFHDAMTQDDVISMHLFEDCTICGEDIERLCVEKTVFRNVVFIDVSFRHIELTDVIFENVIYQTPISAGLSFTELQLSSQKWLE